MEGRVHQRAGDGMNWHEQFDGSKEPVDELSDPELEAELTVAAYAPGRARLGALPAPAGTSAGAVCSPLS